MVLHRLTFLPNGKLDAERLDLNDIDSATSAPFDALFSAQVSFNGPIPFAPNVTAKWTGMVGGQALMSIALDGKLYLSGVLVAGKNAVADSQILQMFADSLEKTILVQQITGGHANPFGAVFDRPERPLLAVVLWPTVPVEMLANVAGLDVLLTASFLRKILPNAD